VLEEWRSIYWAWVKRRLFYVALFVGLIVGFYLIDRFVPKGMTQQLDAALVVGVFMVWLLDYVRNRIRVTRLIRASRHPQ
jgi:hypothetical protein